MTIPELLVYSPDKKRAIATYDYGITRFKEGRISFGREGRTATVYLLDMERLSIIGTLDLQKKGDFVPRTVLDCIWSSDGSRVATIRHDHTIAIWDGLTAKPISTLNGAADCVLSANFSPECNRLAAACNDGAARVWETKSGKLISTLKGHTGGLNDARFDSTGEKLVTAGEDRLAIVWDLKTGTALEKFGAHESGVREASFSRDGLAINTRTWGGTNRVWSAHGACLLKLSQSDRPQSGPWRHYGACHLKQTTEATELWVGPADAQPPE
jgi:WD40 repeat protein